MRTEGSTLIWATKRRATGRAFLPLHRTLPMARRAMSTPFVCLFVDVVLWLLWVLCRVQLFLLLFDTPRPSSSPSVSVGLSISYRCNKAKQASKQTNKQAKAVYLQRQVRVLPRHHAICLPALHLDGAHLLVMNWARIR